MRQVNTAGHNKSEKEIVTLDTDNTTNTGQSIDLGRRGRQCHGRPDKLNWMQIAPLINTDQSVDLGHRGRQCHDERSDELNLQGSAWLLQKDTSDLQLPVSCATVCKLLILVAL